VSAGFLFDPMAGVLPRTHYEQTLGAYWQWSIHHLIWQGTPYDLAYTGELFEDRHWRDYQARLSVFYDTGVYVRGFGG